MNHAATAILAEVLKVKPEQAARLADLLDENDLPIVDAMSGNPLAPDMLARLIHLRRIQSVIEDLIRSVDLLSINLEGVEVEADGWGRRLQMANQLSASLIDTTEQMSERPVGKISQIYKPAGSRAKIDGSKFEGPDPLTHFADAAGATTATAVETPQTEPIDGPTAGMKPRPRTAAGHDEPKPKCKDCDNECDCQ